MSPRRTPAERTDAELVLGSEDASLLDVVDNALNKGVVLSGDLTLALANVDLVYARLSLLLCAADRILPHEDEDVLTRHSARAQLRRRARAAARSASRQEARRAGSARDSVRQRERTRRT